MTKQTQGPNQHGGWWGLDFFAYFFGNEKK